MSSLARMKLKVLNISLHKFFLSIKLNQTFSSLVLNVTVRLHAVGYTCTTDGFDTKTESCIGFSDYKLKVTGTLHCCMRLVFAEGELITPAYVYVLKSD